MQREVARDRAATTGWPSLGPNCMGVIDLTTNSATYIGDVVAVPAARRRRRDRPVGLGDRRVRPLRDRGSGSRGSSAAAREVVLDVCDYLAYCLDDPETHLGHPVRRGLQAAGAVPRPGRPGARARQADHGRQGRAQRPGAGRGGRPLRLARRRGRGSPTPRSTPPGVIRCARPRRAARDRRARRGRPADRAGASGAAGPAS